eukprot:jgi/Tetstr1/421350/TSEL_012319.t1
MQSAQLSRAAAAPATAPLATRRAGRPVPQAAARMAGHRRLASVDSRSRAAFVARRSRSEPTGRGPVRVSAGYDLGPSFDIPASPNLVPDGPWRQVEGSINAPKGFKSSGMYGGLRAKGVKADLALVVADEPAVTAGAFTTNMMCAAPVTYCKEVLERTSMTRAVLINAGQANAATGSQGYQDSLDSVAAVAEALGITTDEVLVESTGVIGRRIKMGALLESVPKLVAQLSDSPEDAHRAAVAITTTDLVSKSVALEGSGMIHPNMATMLGVLTCDAPVTPEVWTGIVKRGSMNSFNQITVDGDTSTNDCVIGLASGAAGGPVISDPASPEAQQLEAAATAILQGMAKSIAWDGEGATCLIECQVTGADSKEDANRVAISVDNLMVKLGDILLMENGQPLEFDAKAASAYLTDTCAVHGTVNIEVGIGKGSGTGMAWGCDLSYDYVKINAEYTT